jgi:hypothetical protein
MTLAHSTTLSGLTAFKGPIPKRHLPTYLLQKHKTASLIRRLSIRTLTMATSSYKYVVLGGGNAGGYAAAEFIKRGGGKDELAIITDEPVRCFCILDQISSWTRLRIGIADHNPLYQRFSPSLSFSTLERKSMLLEGSV